MTHSSKYGISFAGFIFTLFYFLFGLGELLSQLMDANPLHLICKPMLLLVISIYFYISARKMYGKIALLMQFGFFFSWVGDILLMFEQENPLFFMGGLAAFLVTHLFYIGAFSHTASSMNTLSILKKHPIVAAPFLLLGAALYYLFYPNLMELQIPVLAYMVVLILMVLLALNRKNKVSSKSFILVFFGALAFLLSDSLLAVNKFLFPLSCSGIWIMTSYIVAQYLIVRGIIVDLGKEAGAIQANKLINKT